MTTGSRRFFLVERYAPAVDSSAVAAAARRLSESGDSAQHVGTVLVATEEFCLSVFEAHDVAAVVALNEQAGLSMDRVVEVEWFAGSLG